MYKVSKSTYGWLTPRVLTKGYIKYNIFIKTVASNLRNSKFLFNFAHNPRTSPEHLWLPTPYLSLSFHSKKRSRQWLPQNLHDQSLITSDNLQGRIPLTTTRNIFSSAHVSSRPRQQDSWNLPYRAIFLRGGARVCVTEPTVMKHDEDVLPEVSVAVTEDSRQVLVVRQRTSYNKRVKLTGAKPAERSGQIENAPTIANLKNSIKDSRSSRFHLSSTNF